MPIRVAPVLFLLGVRDAALIVPSVHWLRFPGAFGFAPLRRFTHWLAGTVIRISPTIPPVPFASAFWLGPIR